MKIPDSLTLKSTSVSPGKALLGSRKEILDCGSSNTSAGTVCMGGKLNMQKPPNKLLCDLYPWECPKSEGDPSEALSKPEHPQTEGLMHWNKP